MAEKMQQRRDTLENWNLENPVLADGEFGIITDSSNSDDVFRIGDGLSTWKQLAPKPSLDVPLDYKTILFIGASITNWTYIPKLVKDMVKQRYGEDVNVHNIAVAGFTANDLYEYIQGNEIHISSTGIMVDPSNVEIQTSVPEMDGMTVYDLLVDDTHPNYLPLTDDVLVVMHIGGNDVSSGDTLQDGTRLVEGRPFTPDKADHFFTHIRGIADLLKEKNSQWEFCMLDMSYRDYDTDIRAYDVGKEVATAWRREDLGSAPYNEFVYRPLIRELSPRFALDSGENCMQNYLLMYNNWQSLNQHDKVHPEVDGRDLVRRRFVDTIMLNNFTNTKGQILMKSLEKNPVLEEQYYSISFGFTPWTSSFNSIVAGYINYGGFAPEFSSGMVYTHILKSKSMITRDFRPTTVDMIIRHFKNFSHKEDLVTEADKGGRTNNNLGFLKDIQMQSCLYWLPSGVQHYSDDSVNQGTTIINPQIEFQNLDPSRTYSVRIAGSRIPTGSETVSSECRATVITGTVNGTVTDRHGEAPETVYGDMRAKIWDGSNIYANSKEGILFREISPDADGTITFEFEGLTGTAWYVNGMDLVRDGDETVLGEFI